MLDEALHLCRNAAAFSRLKCASIATCLILMVSSTGCSYVNLKKFSTADRIDVRLNPGWYEFEQPFEVQVDRLKSDKHKACTNPDTIAAIYRMLPEKDESWQNHWAVPPESPPVVISFHHKTQWLGSLDLYPRALGHVHNLIFPIDIERSSEMLRILCDCAESGD